MEFRAASGRYASCLGPENLRSSLALLAHMPVPMASGSLAAGDRTIGTRLRGEYPIHTCRCAPSDCAIESPLSSLLTLTVGRVPL